MTNIMRQIRIEKITINVGAGKDQSKLEKGMKLIKNITGIDPVKTVTKKRIPEWGLRPGLPVGCKLTLRGKEHVALLKRLLESKDNLLKNSNFDDVGNVSFGIHEYIDIPDINYDPDIGVMGFQVCITLERPGYRIKRRKNMNRALSDKQKITKEESIEYMEKNFNIKIDEE